MAAAAQGRIQAGASPELNRLMKKVIRHLVPFLVIVYGFNMLDRVNIGFAALTMNKALGLSAAMFGVAGSMYWLGSLVSEIPGTIALSKVGARRMLAALLFAWGIVATCIAFVSTPNGLYTMRLLLGIAEGTCWPGILLYLTYWIPESHRAGVNSKFLICLPLTNILVSPLSALIVSNLHGTMGLAGWKWLFVLEGFPPVILGIISLVYLQDRPSEANWLTEPERRLLREAIDGSSMRDSKHEGLLTAFRHPLCYVFGLGWAGITFFMSAITAFFPLMVKQLGIKHDTHVGLISALPFVAGLFAMLAWGKHSDKKKERLWHAVAAALVGGAGWIGAAFATTAFLKILSIVIATMGLYGVQCTFWAIPPAFLSKKMAAAGLAIIAAEGQLGGFFAPLVFGKLRDMTGSFKLAFVVAACAMLLTALATFAGVQIGRARKRLEVAATAAAAATAQSPN
jgi:ACS family tartrate transporter-like MFS transporter